MSAVGSTRDVYERGIRLYNAGDLDRYVAELAEDAVLTRPDPVAVGRSAIRRVWAREVTAFPDRVLTTEVLLEQDHASLHR